MLALGQDVDLALLDGVEGLEVKDGVVQVGPNMMTGAAGIFAGGDMVPSERTVTVAVGHGKKAARHIDAWLRGGAYTPAPKHEIASADNALPVADALLAAEKVKTVLEASAGRREDRAARAAHEDFDDDEAEALEAEGEEEEELLDAAAGVVGALLAAFGDAAMPAVDAVMPLMAPLLQPSSAAAVNGGSKTSKAAKAKAAVTHGERRVAVCLVDDVVEHSPLGAARYGPQALPLLR